MIMPRRARSVGQVDYKGCATHGPAQKQQNSLVFCYRELEVEVSNEGSDKFRQGAYDGIRQRVVIGREEY